MREGRIVMIGEEACGEGAFAFPSRVMRDGSLTE